MVKLLFKQLKKKPIRLRFFKSIMFPRRSKAEWKLIDKNPFGDADRDRVPNIFDCKPFNRKKQGKFSQNIPIHQAKKVYVYHTTHKKNIPSILKEGLHTHVKDRNFIYEHSYMENKKGLVFTTQIGRASCRERV